MECELDDELEEALLEELLDELLEEELLELDELPLEEELDDESLDEVGSEESLLLDSLESLSEVGSLLVTVGVVPVGLRPFPPLGNKLQLETSKAVSGNNRDINDFFILFTFWLYCLSINY